MKVLRLLVGCRGSPKPHPDMDASILEVSATCSPECPCRPQCSVSRPPASFMSPSSYAGDLHRHSSSRRDLVVVWQSRICSSGSNLSCLDLMNSACSRPDLLVDSPFCTPRQCNFLTNSHLRLRPILRSGRPPICNQVRLSGNFSPRLVRIWALLGCPIL